MIMKDCHKEPHPEIKFKNTTNFERTKSTNRIDLGKCAIFNLVRLPHSITKNNHYLNKHTQRGYLHKGSQISYETISSSTVTQKPISITKMRFKKLDLHKKMDITLY